MREELIPRRDVPRRRRLLRLRGDPAVMSGSQGIVTGA